MNAYAEAAHAVESTELITSADFRRMLLALLQAPVDFNTDDEGEDYCLKNTMGCAKIWEKSTHVNTIYGRDWKA